MFTIGLTGGIASGKTTVSHLFSELGVPIVDTDLISRYSLELDQPAYHLVVEHFGDKLLHKDLQIDRRELRRIVFNDEAEKHWLETVLHPIIYRQTSRQIEKHKEAAYVMVVIPLLFEANFEALVDRILVIDCRPETQIRRLIARDSIDLKLAQQMLAQQLDNEARLNKADDVIRNDDNLTTNLDQQVIKLHQQYVLLDN